MDTGSLQSLSSDPSYYDKAFKVFCARSAKDKVFSDWVDGVFSEAVVGKLHVTLDEQEELWVLGVGSGSGVLDIMMLKQLNKRFPLIDNRVVEPSQKMVVEYEAGVRSMAHQLHGVKCDFRQQTIEQYQKAGDSTKFHFISAVHSMYYVDDFHKSMMNLYDLLMPGGMLLVILKSKNNGWNRLLDRFSQFGCQVTSSDIRHTLGNLGIPYEQYHQPNGLDITPCFDQASEEGGLLLDFLMHSVNFKEMVPQDIQKSMMEYLASSDCSEWKNGALELSIDWDAIVTVKPQQSI